jgi:hypothetical protein
MTVYALQCQQTQNVKIGYTARLVQSRLSELRTAASTPIELVKWYPGLTEDHEKWFHSIFAQYRVAGEWFKQDVLSFIDHEAESIFISGQCDFKANSAQGAVTAKVMTVSVAALKVGTQNMKMSFFEQLPGRRLCKEEPEWIPATKEDLPTPSRGLIARFDYSKKVGYSTENYYCESILQGEGIDDDGQIVHHITAWDGTPFKAPHSGLVAWARPREEAVGFVWGRVSIPIKHYGNVNGYNSYLIAENDGILEKLTLSDNSSARCYLNYQDIKSLFETSQQLFFGA